MQEGNLHKWFKGSKSKDGKSGWVNVVTGGTCASDEPGEGTPKCVSSSKRASMTPAERKSAQRRKKAADPNQQQKSGAAKPTYVSTDKPKKKMKEETFNEEDKKGKGSGKKDACYHKVKSRYSVWPSAYASGALVKCRKKGAKNWGSSTKKEEFLALPEFTELQIDAMRKNGIEVEVVDEACWKTHEQRGMKKKGNRMVPNCVPKGSVREQVIAKLKGELPLKDAIEESVRVPAQNGNVYAVAFTWRGKYMMMKLFFPEVKKPSRNEVQDALAKVYPGCMVQRFDLTTFQPTDAVLNVGVKEGSELKYCPKCKKLETRSDCAYGGSYWDENAKEVSTNDDGSMEVSEGAAWTRKEGQNKEGGLNEKGRKSYERDNPGSDLKAPSKKVGNKRRASFCARMKGMKKKLTSSKTANDPDSRINKSLRAWNC